VNQQVEKQALIAQITQLRTAMLDARAAGREAAAEHYAGVCADLGARSLSSTAALRFRLRTDLLISTAYRDPPDLDVRLRELADECRRVFGPVHRTTLYARRAHIPQVVKAGRPLQAERVADELAQDAIRLLGREHPEARLARQIHALMLAGIGRCDEALVAVDALGLSRAAARRPAAAAGPQDAVVQDEPSEAEAAIAEAAAATDEVRLTVMGIRGWWPQVDTVLAGRIERLLRRLGPHHPDYLKAIILRARALASAGDPETALELSAQGSDGLVEQRGFEALANFEAYIVQSRALQSLDDPVQAETAARYTLDQAATRWGGAHTVSAAASVALASALITQSRPAEALPLAESAAAAYRAGHGDAHPGWLNGRFTAAEALAGLGRATEARATHQAILADRVRILGEEHPDTRSSYRALAVQPPDAS
jgi:hypothetical protein